MKKISITLGISLVCGLAFMNSNNVKNQDLATVSLASIMQEAQAGAEGCTTKPGSNSGDCVKNVSGATYNCVSSFWSNCSSD